MNINISSIKEKEDGSGFIVNDELETGIEGQMYEDVMEAINKGQVVLPEFSDEELTSQKEDSEREWRDNELKNADIQIYIIDDDGGDSSMWRQYRKDLRAYPEQQDFPNGIRPVRSV